MVTRWRHLAGCVLWRKQWAAENAPASSVHQQGVADKCPILLQGRDLYVLKVILKKDFKPAIPINRSGLCAVKAGGCADTCLPCAPQKDQGASVPHACHATPDCIAVSCVAWTESLLDMIWAGRV